MHTPIQVYLDSSDFSELAERNNRPNKKELDEIYEFLVDARKQGKIQIRYSSITVLECIHQQPEHMNYALRRASIIEELSGGNSFVDLLTLHLETCLDTLVPRNTSESSRDRLMRKHHQWYIDISPILASYEKIYIDKANEIIETRPKSTRNQLKKMMFSGRRLSNFAIKRLTIFGDAFERAYVEQYPMLNGFPLQKTMTKYLKGEFSQAEVIKQIGDTVFNPFNFTKWFVESIKNKTPSSLNSLREQGALIVSAIESSRADFDMMMLAHSQGDLSEKEVQKKLKAYRYPVSAIRKMLLDSIFSSKKVSIKKHGFSEKLWEERILQSDIGSLLSIDFVSELFSEHITKKIHDRRSKLSPSDFGDFMHFSYAPFVDVFRCDKRTASLASSLVKKYGLDAYIAPNLTDAIGVIKSKVSF